MNLFSRVPIILEKYGSDTLVEALQMKSNFYYDVLLYGKDR